MVKATVLLILLVPPVPALAQRVQAALDCRFTGTDFVYECLIRLKRAGEPLAGTQIAVGADMPSMPMAHNVKPVKANPGKAPGEHEARLDLEMSGEWVVELRLAGPVQDQLSLSYEFDEKGARPAKPATRTGKPLRN